MGEVYLLSVEVGAEEGRPRTCGTIAFPHCAVPRAGTS